VKTIQTTNTPVSDVKEEEASNKKQIGELNKIKIKGGEPTISPVLTNNRHTLRHQRWKKKNLILTTPLSVGRRRRMSAFKIASTAISRPVLAT